ncbi:T9SS type A sorting domain-containing protein [Lewinella sp. W8]|uniref:T9SS type A sorting domain-containing protein n=1 Tax=Lewinella sp. W8 TaxID=2528208 RepID=UPI001067B9C5|nr:T9SS type A sorting domain-containing protein [Lewinella sp. W8]MTB53878.1 T9SS type A sorting domain-containing protein [Lewinella sp. W8]
MKQLLLTACLSFFAIGLSAQVVYVNDDVAVPGDGSSWDNAYANLNDALLAAASGSEVWIAQGTYITPDSSAFIVDNKSLTILGGFVGNETMASEADPEKNATILSGDVMQNDVQGSFDSLSRVDNQRVLIVADTNAVSTFTVTIDGLILQDGSLPEFVDGSLVPFAGGGLWTTAKVAVSRTTFRANYAPFGSAIFAIFENTAGSTFDDIVVEDNYAGDDGTIYVRLTNDVTFSNSSFSAAAESAARSGMVFALEATGLTIEGCDFKNIDSPVWRGSGIRTSDVLGIDISNCTFDSLSADLGAAIYLRNGNDFEPMRAPDATEAVMDSCTFTNIASDRWGGAIFIGNVSHSVTNSSFTDVEGNAGGGLGGAMYAQNGDTYPYAYVADNLTFTRVDGGPGGAHFWFTDGLDITLTNSSYTDISGNASGGGVYFNGSADFADTATLANLTFENVVGGGFGGGLILLSQNFVADSLSFSMVEGGATGGVGGGMYAQGPGMYAEVTNSSFEQCRGTSGSGLGVNNVGGGGVTIVRNSTFDNNGGAAAAFRGGGFLLFGNGGAVPSDLTVDNCTFTNNRITSEQGVISGGGGMYVNGDLEPMNLTITNSLFDANSALEQENGAGIFLIDGVNGTIDDTDFFNNNATSDGGALATFMFPVIDTVDMVQRTRFPDFDVTVSNALIILNTADNQGGAVSTQRTGMNFTNCVFANNQVTTDGNSGGAIIFNGHSPAFDQGGELLFSGEIAIDVQLIHNTFFSNFKGTSDVAVGEQIAFFQPDNITNADVNSMTVQLLNNVFFSDTGNPNLEVELAGEGVEIGNLMVTSLGGNFFDAENGENLGLDTSGDIVQEGVDAEDFFVDPFEDNPDAEFADVTPLYDEMNPDANPLVGGAVLNELVPDAGIFGNPRGDSPEIGAIELPFGLTSVEDIEESGLDMSFFPNPTVNEVNIQHNDPTISTFTVLVTDMQGRIVTGRQFREMNNRLDVSALPTGVYNLQLMINGRQYSKQIVKQ